LSHICKDDPFENLQRVIGTTHVFEQEAPRNLSDIRTSWTEVSQDDMSPKVAKNTKNDGYSTDVDFKVTSVLSKLGMVKKVSNISAAQDPVMKRVLENVENRHGFIPKPMNENSFEFSLKIMK